MPPLPGLPTKGMERMEVDQCAGAAGGAGGGALRRSNSAPMITGVRLVQLHPHVHSNSLLEQVSHFVFSMCHFMQSQGTCKEQCFFCLRLLPSVNNSIMIQCFDPVNL